MCGRYKQTTPLQTLRELYGIKTLPETPPAAHIAPGMKAAVVKDGKAGALRWGFTPHWAKEDMGTKLINARAETIAEKPSFRDSFAARRCLVPADGFYEWDKSQKPARAYDIHFADKAPFAMAGLWDAWADPATGEVRESFVIITVPAAPMIAHIHERMPAILRTPEECALWAAQGASAAELKNLLKPCDSGTFSWTAATFERPPANEDLPEDGKQLPLF